MTCLLVFACMFIMVETERLNMCPLHNPDVGGGCRGFMALLFDLPVVRMSVGPRHETCDPVLRLAGAAACLAALALPLASVAGGTALRNPPSECKAADSDCGCDSGEGVSDGCIKASLDMGRTTPWTGSQRCAIKVFADDQSPLVFTPESLFAVCGYAFRRVGSGVLPDGETPSEVVLSHPDGEAVRFVFSAGEPVGVPDPGLHSGMDERLMMVDAAGWACTNAPVYYDLFEGDGTVRRFLATDATNERGRLVSVTDARGVVRTPADMGVDVVLGADGVRQFLTPSRLADVRVLSDGYEVRVYAISGDAPARDAATGLYPVPAAAPVRTLSVRSSDGGRRAVVTLRRGESDPLVHVFDYAAGDWSLTRQSGVREVRERSVVDSTEALTTRETRSATGVLLSRDEYAYAWRSWGFAATNHVEGFGTARRVTSWTHFDAGDGKGRVATERKSSGLLTSFAYDAKGRVASKTASAPGLATETTTFSYASVDPSDVVPPVDSRPRTVVKTVGGMETERTYYVHSSLTDVVERAASPGAAFGAAGALRTVTERYPVVAGDLRSGLVKSVRREDGRLAVHHYSLDGGVWTETVTHLHERATSPVEGRTTREVTRTNARGEEVEVRTDAFVGGAWRTVSRTLREFDAEGRCIRSEDLAGRATATEWDCCRKVSETSPDGSIMTWDYDEEGRLVESAQLVPLDMTAVAWISTRRSYDGLDREVATWATNIAAVVGLPSSRTSYDALGRVVSRTDAAGLATTFSYSADGLVTTTTNPDGAKSVVRRDALGRVASVTGAAVTPEFRFEEALPGGFRRTRVARGETAASRRFAVREENMLGQAVREERGGFGGATLATVHEYDGFGRLVRTASDGEPAVEFDYDELGDRVATEQRAYGAWRREETGTRHVLLDGEVWLVTTNATFCSDARVAPLVTSRAVQLSGLSAANPARSRETDVRGNVTESWTETADGFSSAFRRTPEASNAAVERARFGVRMQTTSASLVTNSVVCDSLGRVCEEIDGRGNSTRTEYDAAGRRVAVCDGAGNPTRYVYDRAGRLAAVTNALGHAVVYEYDQRGNKTYEGGSTYPVRYAYDVFGDRVSMTTYRDESKGADSGDVTRWLRDEATGLVTNKVYADGMGPSYDYDANGRLTRRTWARGIVTDYAYDGWGNLTNTAYSDGTPTVSLRYDAMGRLVEARDAAGVTTFAYDAYGNVTNETVIGEIQQAED